MPGTQTQRYLFLICFLWMCDVCVHSRFLFQTASLPGLCSHGKVYHRCARVSIVCVNCDVRGVNGQTDKIQQAIQVTTVHWIPRLQGPELYRPQKPPELGFQDSDPSAWLTPVISNATAFRAFDMRSEVTESTLKLLLPWFWVTSH